MEAPFYTRGRFDEATRAASSFIRPVVRGAVDPSGCAGCAAAAGALDTFISPRASSVAADGALFV